MNISQTLAAFSVNTRWEDLPVPIRAECVRSVRNGFATALGAWSDPAMTELAEVLIPFSGPENAGIIGRRERVDMLSAACMNAMAINLFDFDDTHVDTIIHPTAPVLPVLLALAETRQITGQDFLCAFGVGVDVACRLGNAVSPGHYRRGWHITATCGAFGAAAAAGRILGLDREGMVLAFGHAAAQCSGLVETLGTNAKSVGVGGAARGGLLAAILGGRGVSGPADPIGGRLGFLNVLCDAPQPDRAIAGLGTEWELARNTYKPYPCGVVVNPVLDACLALQGQPGLDLAAIMAITVRGPSLLKERTDRPDVETGRESQVSSQHAVAVALLRGAAGVAEFSDAAVCDPAVLALRARVRQILADDSMPAGSAEVTLEFADGTTRSHRVNEARGSLARPMSDADLDHKLRTLAALGCPGLDPEPLLKELHGIEHSPSAGAVMRCAAPT